MWATDLVEMPWRLRGALTAMLSGVVVVRDLAAALDLVAARPQLRAVTADGDLVGAGWVSGGSDRKPSTLEITSEIEKAREELAAAEKQTGELTAALSGALAEQTARQDAAEQALAALNESDAAISAIYEQLGRLGQDARNADDEWQRLIRQRDELETGRVQTVEELTELEQRLHNAEQAPMFDADAHGPPGNGRRRRGGPRRRGGGPAGGAHRRGARECRSRTGGFAAPRRRGRARGPAACAARAGSPRARGGGRRGGGRVRPRCVAQRLSATVSVASRTSRRAGRRTPHQRIERVGEGA